MKSAEVGERGERRVQRTRYIHVLHATQHHYLLKQPQPHPAQHHKLSITVVVHHQVRRVRHVKFTHRVFVIVQHETLRHCLLYLNIQVLTQPRSLHQK